jgi:hypothetical protein
MNFLLTCSDQHLAEYELKILADVANAREELIEVLDRLSALNGQAGIVRWFRAKDRDQIRRDLESDNTLEIAKEQIRADQRSDDEIIPRPSLPPGSAHLAAALRYQKRNIAEGKCICCPEPLAHNSATFCEKHLREKRLRYKPKNAKGSLPGSIGWLHGEGFESQHGRQPGTLQSLAMNREKKSRAILAQMGLPAGSTATALGAATELLLWHMPRSENEAPLTVLELFEKAGLSDSLVSTAKHALLELVSSGQVQRIGKGVRGNPYLYFVAGNPERAKRELAVGHALENAGRHLRGAR